MAIVTVVRHVPQPVIGVIGTHYDPAFETFEADLDWLESTGMLVERFDPTTAADEVAARPVVQQAFSAEGDRCLPLILVGDAVVARGAYPSRAQLARAVGRGPHEEHPDVVRQLATLGAVAAIGADEEVQSEAAHARALGIGEEAVRLATEAGAHLRARTRPAA